MRMTRAFLAALCLLSLPASALAQDLKITQLPLAAPLTGTEKVPAVQAGGNVAATPNQVVTLAAQTLQAKSPVLTSIAGQTWAVDKCVGWTASTTVAPYTCTSFWRGLGVSADAAAVRSALGVSGTGADTTYLIKASNLSDLTSASTARTNLGLVIGTNVQAWDADLDALGALTGTSTIYYRSASNTWSPVTIGANLTFTSGTLAATGGGSGITALTGDVAASGTGSVTATLATVNSNTGACGSGTAIPTVTLNGKGLATACTTTALNSALTQISGLSPSNDDVIQRKGGVWTNRTIAQLKADLGVPQSADLQVFNASGTWTKPAYGTTTRVIIFGGGGGSGAGGTAGAGVQVSGGGGGGGVHGLDRTFSTSALGSTETVTVGAGGAVNSQGGNSTFGSWITSYGGGGGSNGASGLASGGGGASGPLLPGNNASGATGGAAAGIGSVAGGSGAGGAASNFGSGGAGTGTVTFPGAGGYAGILLPSSSSGGGSGGGISAADAPSAGGTGGGTRAQQNSGVGAAGGALGNNAGVTPTTAFAINEGGGGGGGGGASATTNAGNGAPGQVPGGGAGGGGAARTGFTAGAGAAGGAGRVIVITE